MNKLSQERTLLTAAVILIIALTPSIKDVIDAHQEDHPQKLLLWGWIALALVVALAFGEVITGK